MTEHIETVIPRDSTNASRYLDSGFQLTAELKLIRLEFISKFLVVMVASVKAVLKFFFPKVLSHFNEKGPTSISPAREEAVQRKPS